MGTKLEPGKFDCYASAADDEPMFILLGRDKHAPTLVWLWATLRELDGENPAKVDEARACVASMLTWQKDHEKKAVGLGQAALAGVMELLRAANYAFQNAPDPKTQNDRLRLYMAHSELEPSNAESSDAKRQPPEETRAQQTER